MRNKSLSDVPQLLAEFLLSTIDNTGTGPSVTSHNGSDTCGYFFGSDVSSCLTDNNSKTTYNWIIKIVVMHSA